MGDVHPSNAVNWKGRMEISNLEDNSEAKRYFDEALIRMYAFHHEEAVKYFKKCLKLSPECALAHALIAHCHAPNYNFYGEAYYSSTSSQSQQNEQQCSTESMTIEATDALGIDTDKFKQNQFTSGLKSCGPEVSNSNTVTHTSMCTSVVRDHHSTTLLSSQHHNLTGNSSEDGNEEHSLEDDFPSQEVAEHHSRQAIIVVSKYNGSPIKVINDINNGSNHNNKGHHEKIQEKEVMLIKAIRLRTSLPGIAPEFSEQKVGRPYADEMRKLHLKYPGDADIAFLFAEALLVLNAWKLFEYPTGRPLSPDVNEVAATLKRALKLCPDHPGLCHLYVHLCEMSPNPSDALQACEVLKNNFPDAGHLLHMPSHIDVLIGDYVACVEYNSRAIEVDKEMMKRSPETSGPLSFYFGYIAHNYHMLVYGAILGGMEGKAMEVAKELNNILVEELFLQNPGIELYLESYSSLDIHIMVRFGRWEEILELEFPRYQNVMLYRTASLLYAKALAQASLGNIHEAKDLHLNFEIIRKMEGVHDRVLHNNTVADLLGVDSPMLLGEIFYRQGKFDEAFALLRKAVQLQDELNYDEPWGKMQPVRHALGGLLLEQSRWAEAEKVFRDDLDYHPNNPWSLIGLIKCLDLKLLDDSSPEAVLISSHEIRLEKAELQSSFNRQRQSSSLMDYDIQYPCACCGKNICYACCK